MQQQRQEQSWANQMERIPAFSMSSNPNVGFGGLTEVGCAETDVDVLAGSLNQDKDRPLLRPHGRLIPVLQNSGVNLAPVHVTDVCDDSWVTNGKPINVGAGDDSWLHLPHTCSCGNELNCWNPRNSLTQTTGLSCPPSVFTGATAVSPFSPSAAPITHPYGFHSFRSPIGSTSLNRSFESGFLHSPRNSDFFANLLIPFDTNWQDGTRIPLPTDSMNTGIHNGTGFGESFIGNDFQSCIQTDNCLSAKATLSGHSGLEATHKFLNGQHAAAQDITVSSDVASYSEDQYASGQLIDHHAEPASIPLTFNNGMNIQYASQGVTMQQQEAPAPPQNPNPGYACTHSNCFRVFRRDPDRLRHVATAHNANNVGVHLCPVVGCTKSYGVGYSRADKVKEHLWRKHANLGYVKGRM